MAGGLWTHSHCQTHNAIAGASSRACAHRGAACCCQWCTQRCVLRRRNMRVHVPVSLKMCATILGTSMTSRGGAETGGGPDTCVLCVEIVNKPRLA